MKSLFEAQTLFIDEIKKKAKEIDKTKGPIWDGIADISAYIQSSPRVAWILKEPYDEEPSEDGWSHPEYLSKLTLSGINSKLTWRRVNETMFAIRNHCFLDETKQITDNYLKDIAWLNLSKMPGKSTSDSSFKRYYRIYWLDILRRQVETYNPEIIIFGNTFDICKNDLFPNNYRLIERNHLVHVYRSGPRLILFTYHPGWWGITDANYVNSVIRAIQIYYAGK